MGVAIKRAYKQIDQTDGKRILIDRIWPRGIAKQALAIDLWLKDVAPSTELRKWFNHDPEKFQRFMEQYQIELSEDQEKKEALQRLQTLKKDYDQITLIYGAKNETCNHAIVLKEILT